MENSVFSPHLYLSVAALLKSRVWKSPPLPPPCLLVLFSPRHLVSALNTLPLWVAYNKLLIYDQAIKNRKFRSIRKDGFYFGKGPNPMNFLFFLSGMKWAWFFSLDRLQTGARYVFHPRTTGVYLSLFIPEPHPLVRVRSIQRVYHPADSGQGCSWNCERLGVSPGPGKFAIPLNVSMCSLCRTRVGLEGSASALDSVAFSLLFP